MHAVQVVRVHDPARRPASWTAIIGPRQLVAFAKDADDGAACDAAGQRFADPSGTTCILFDSLAEARAFCDAAVRSAPRVRFDVFDAEGRANAPLLTIVDPSRARSLDTHPRGLRTRRAIAWSLIAAGLPLVIYAYWRRADIEVIFPTFIGINLVIAGGRLLWLNLAIRETERARAERLQRLDR
jgi:hypothetical protein